MIWRTDVYKRQVNLSAIEGATPSPFVYMLDGYGIKWSGKILPSVSGEYTIDVYKRQMYISSVA